MALGRNVSSAPPTFLLSVPGEWAQGRGAVMRYVAAHPEVMYPLEIPKALL